MIKFYIINQTIRFSTPAIAADSLKYLECEFDFTGEGWEEASKWAHFRQERDGEDTVYDIAIEDNHISADKKLNLTIGEWEVYVTGTLGETRITTVPVILTVYESGLIDGPLHEMPLTVAEQVDAKANTALLMAQAVKEAADGGMFDGKDGIDGKDGTDGKGIEIGDYYTSFSQLIANAPKDNKLYGVGNNPVVFYGWSSSQQSWILVGTVQGIPGEDGAPGAPGAAGKDGVIFYPSVSESGFLSWTNDGGMENPAPVNIIGPKGDTGQTGAAGKGPYEYAQDGGYTGTEETFIAAMTQYPYHHTRHEAGGADPITVSKEMLAEDAKSKDGTVTLEVSGWTGNGPYINTVNASGMRATDRPVVDILCSEFSQLDALEEAWSYIYRVTTAAGSISFYAKAKPQIALTVQYKAVRL